MKLILMAAAAVCFSAPAYAQSSGSAGTNSPTTTGAQTEPGVNENGQAFQEANTPDTQTATDKSMQTDSMTDPVGGYQPANPPMPANVPPGATIRFQAAPSPSEAYPAPAPMDSYPVCKPGQFDDCVERNSPK